ncbi:Uu.00g104470.m01.CDS01 [Anthostomella pinea]|uniref:Uu.00g104470.m01.CDS01 n=1 Tax=Anthostomella pinea TaxID=933095 RepID=A0AAI8VEQ6_9PEZI|nr:Uu.00g104470.m01.CDS01 [Anthostomella pinea]
MTPPCRVFPASQLESEIQVNDDGRRRKGGKIDLSACELLSMVQYECKIDHPEASGSPVRCWPVQRWFRRCRDNRGAFTVETTMWEGKTLPVEAEKASKTS